MNESTKTGDQGDRSGGGAIPVLRFRPRKVLFVVIGSCVLIELFLVFLDATVNYANWTSYGMIRRLVNITREDALASWFGVTQTCMVALTLWLIYVMSKRDGSTRRVAIGWMALALIFTYMTVDDGAEIHERMGSAYKKYHAQKTVSSDDDSDARSESASPGIGGKLLRLFPSYPWQILFLPMFGAIGLFVLFFLWRQLESPLPRIAVVFAIACFVFAVGCDFIEGLDKGHPWNLYTRIAKTWDLYGFTQDTFDESPFDTLRHFSKSVEEFAEMLGMTTLWAVFLSTLMKKARRLQLEFIDPAPEASVR